jgi:hypothetical protein
MFMVVRRLIELFGYLIANKVKGWSFLGLTTTSGIRQNRNYDRK